MKSAKKSTPKRSYKKREKIITVNPEEFQEKQINDQMGYIMNIPLKEGQEIQFEILPDEQVLRIRLVAA